MTGGEARRRLERIASNTGDGQSARPLDYPWWRQEAKCGDDGSITASNTGDGQSVQPVDDPQR